MGSSSPQDSGTPYRRRRAFEDTARYVTGEEDIARDYGFSGWLDLYPSRDTVLEIGYSRSMFYRYNTLFFSVRFNIGNMIWSDRHRSVSFSSESDL